ncbi:MAG: hypothetical protein KC619_19340 [Myxococcales bacterium]|nr:hypothetical protein [Myxococcales bacterium]
MGRLVLCVLLLGACGSDDARRPSSSPAGEPDRGATIAAPSAVRDFCGSPDEARIREAHPELPDCFQRAYTYLEAQVAGHALLVLSREADPCCTDVPSPATDAGASVYVDGQPRPAFDPIALGASPADATEALALMTAELMRQLVARPVVDEAGARALRGSWSEAGAAIERARVGLTRDGATWRLRALGASQQIERGIHCRTLSVWDVEADGAGVRARVVTRYGAGEAMGAPCPGEPLP